MKKNIYGFNQNNARRIANATRRVENTPLGSKPACRRPRSISSGASGGNPDSFPCRITGGGPGLWEVDIYANGKDQPSTDSGLLEVLDLNLSENVTGEWVVGHASTVSVLNDEA